MNCLLTGGSGFLGSHVADELAKKGHQVTIFDEKKTKWLKKNQRFLKGSILKIKNLEKAFKNIDVVYHFAALSDLNFALNKPHETVKTNILGTVNILELSKKYKVGRLIFSSSIYVNSEQGGFYRSSKRAAEDYIEEFSKRFKLNFTILRFGSLYGERSDKSNGVRKIIESGKYTGEIKYYGNPKSVRRYIYVKDAAKSCVEALKKKYKNKYLIITGKKSVSIKKLLKLVNKLYGYRKKIKFHNKKLLGHYIQNPFTYKFRNGSNLVLKKQLKFEAGIKKVFFEINK